MRLVVPFLAVLAGPVSAESDVTSVMSGRFHIEVVGQADGRFVASATPTADQTPMTPVNEAGLHLSCLLIPDLREIETTEIMAALQVGADRYCHAQFGADQVGVLGDVNAAYFSTTSGVSRINGRCEQAPI